jgi:hypothetical protein
VCGNNLLLRGKSRFATGSRSPSPSTGDDQDLLPDYLHFRAFIYYDYDFRARKAEEIPLQPPMELVRHEGPAATRT